MPIEESSVRAMGGQGTDKRISGSANGAQFVLVTVHDDDSGGGGGGTVTYKVAVDTAAGGTWTLDLESDHFYQGVGSVNTYNHGDLITINATAYDEAGNGTAAPATVFAVSEFGPQFADPVTLANVEGTGSDKMTNLHIGDFNGDGAMDYATSYGDNTNEMVMRLKDNGTPGNTDYTALNFYSQSGDRIERSAVGDANGDGIDDIMYVDIDGYLTLAEGDGTTIRSYLSDLPRIDIDTMLMFDFDGDGDLDIVFGSDYTSSYAELNIYENDGAGNFNSLTGVDSDNATVTDIKRADFNDDGKDDLIVNVNSSSKANFVVMSGEDSQGNPTFNTYAFSTEPTSFKMEVGLLDDNDQEDVIWTDDGTFIIYYDMGANGLAASSSEFIYSDGAMDPIDVEIMDYDGDGNNDILVAYQHSSSESSVDLEVFLTNDSGWVTGSQVLLDSGYTNYYTLDLIDYNSDGIEDIFIGGTTQNSETVLIRGGANLQAGNIGTSSGPTGVNQLNAESASSNASLLLRVDASTMAVGQTIELFDPSGNSIFTTTTASDGSGGVQGLSGDYLTITLDSAAMTALSGLGDGNHTLRVDMADAFKNTVSASIMIEQATTLPTLTVDDTVLNENSPGSISDDSVQITGTSTDANYILVTIADDGVGSSPNTATYRVNPDSTGAWTLDLDTATPQSGTATTVDQNDTFSITASAHGDLNNTGTTATSTDFIVSGPGPQFAEAETIDNVLANYSYAMTNIKVGDFNGDGFDDFAGMYSGDNDIRLYFTDGVVGSTTTTRMSKAARSNLDAMDVGDVTGDGIDDVVYMDGSEYLMTLQGDGTLSSTYIYQLPTSTINDMVLFDYDGDGDLDLAIATAKTSSGQEIHVYTNDGNGNFSSGYSHEVNLNTRGLAKGDFNNDGMEDLVAVSDSSNYNDRLYISTSTTDTPSFDVKRFAQDSFSAMYGEGLVVDYLGSDTQKQDIVVGDYTYFTIFYDMEESGSYLSTTDVYYSGGGEDPVSIELMDYDGDGTKDIIAIYQNTSSEPSYDAAVFLTNNTGQVTESFILIEGGTSNPVDYAGGAILDYNNDGIEDVLITSQNTNNDVLVLRGGAALQAANIGTSGGPTGVNQLNAESLTSNASLALRVDPATITIGHTVKLFDPSGNSIFTTTLQNDGSGGVQGLSGDYLTVTLDSAAMTALSALGDGNHTLHVEMADAFNNGASANITIEQASTVPTISVDDTVLNENGAGSITDDSVQITGTSSDANYILVTVADDGGGSSANTATYKVSPDSTGTWTLDLDTATPQGGNAITTDNGDTFSVTASAHGTLNNTGTTATANDYVVDLFAPTLMPQYDTFDYYEFAWPVTNYVTNYYNAGTFGDVNGDGNIDFAATLDGTGNDAGVFYGNNGGTFDDQGDIALVTSQSVRTTELVDLNGDGYDDMIIIDRRYVYTVLADGNGGFENTTNLLYDSGNTYLGDMYGAPVSTGDFNGDGHMDFSFTNSYGNEIAGGLYTFMGNGTGTSFDEQFLRTEDSQYDVNTASQMADVTGDGIADMIYFKRGASSPWSHYLTVTAGQDNTGTPLVQNWSQTIYTGYDNNITSTLEVADLNGDGWKDIAFTHGNTPYIEIYLNTQGGHYSNSYNANSVSVLDLNALLGRSVYAVHDMELTDIDGDGDTDILLALASTSSSYIDEQVILTQNADGSFSEFSSLTFDGRAINMGGDRGISNKVQYEDFNGDGLLDTLIFNRALSNNNGYDPRIHWGRVATVTGDVINQDNEILTVALGDATAAGDTLVVTYNGNQIGTATTTATDISNGSMDITLNNVENLYNGGRNQLTFTISDALGGTNTYLQSMEVATNSAASNSYILHFDGEADTLTSFTAGDGAGGDKMNISQLLTDAGYTGNINWNDLESGGYIDRTDDGSGNTIISVDKDGSAGTTHNLQHIVTLNNTTASNLDDDDIE